MSSTDAAFSMSALWGNAMATFIMCSLTRSTSFDGCSSWHWYGMHDVATRLVSMIDLHIPRPRLAMRGAGLLHLTIGSSQNAALPPCPMLAPSYFPYGAYMHRAAILQNELAHVRSMTVRFGKFNTVTVFFLLRDKAAAL